MKHTMSEWIAGLAISLGWTAFAATSGLGLTMLISSLFR